MIFSKNKKAFHDFEILEKLEAGLVLEGMEVKQIRKGKMQLKGSFCRFFKNELFIIDSHIGIPTTADKFGAYEEQRARKLLLNKKQLNNWLNKVDLDGLSIVVLDVYSNDKNKIKCTAALAKGKKLYDKRQSLKDKDIKRDIQRNMKGVN